MLNYASGLSALEVRPLSAEQAAAIEESLAPLLPGQARAMG